MALGEVFLIILGLIWITFAVVQDLRKREIANWLNFSLAIFAIAFRFFYSLFQDQGFSFFFQGVIGLAVFFLIGNLLYYGKVFAGGDAKLMISLGAIIPFSDNFLLNINAVFTFLLLFLIFGALYGIIIGLFLGIKNRERFIREFSSQFKKNKKTFYISIILGIILLLLAFFEIIFLYLGILIFLSPYVYFSAKSIDEACMVRKVSTKELTEGDWLYHNIKVGRKIIEARWSGISKEELFLLRKKKKEVLIRQGIPFSPVFIISYIGLVYLILLQEFYLF
ncbi:MAG: A24 family peptidase [Nanobdellota archaeon]